MTMNQLSNNDETDPSGWVGQFSSWMKSKQKEEERDRGR